MSQHIHSSASAASKMMTMNLHESSAQSSSMIGAVLPPVCRHGKDHAPAHQGVAPTVKPSLNIALSAHENIVLIFPGVRLI